MSFENVDDDMQPYKFGGKKLLAMHGLNQYDSKARMQEFQIPRFTSVDPLCEKYYSVSPYAYCNNNPVNLVDPDGRQIVFPPIFGMNPVLMGSSNPIVSTGRMLSTTDKVVKALPQEAHHIIPKSLKGNKVIEAAKEGGFKMEGKGNKISVDKFSRATGEGQHGKHPNYTKQIRNKLENYKKENPNFTPEQALDQINNIGGKIKNTIENNPNTKINDLQLDQRVLPIDNTKVARPDDPIKIKYRDPRFI